MTREDFLRVFSVNRGKQKALVCAALEDWQFHQRGEQCEVGPVLERLLVDEKQFRPFLRLARKLAQLEEEIDRAESMYLKEHPDGR